MNDIRNLILVTQWLKRINRIHEKSITFIAGWSFILAIVLLTFSSGLCQDVKSLPNAEKHPTDTAALDGLMILDTRCSVCHSADKPKQAKKTPEQWEQTVSRMIDKGAELSKDEKKVLLDYLSDTYGKKTVK